MKTKLYNVFNNLDYATVDKLMKEVTAYGYSRAWVIPIPLSDTQEVWWPWIKNYNGEMDLGYCQTYAWARYTWLDQELKKSMGY
jgi:peptide/nickel transport system substrate-binding protein